MSGKDDRFSQGTLFDAFHEPIIPVRDRNVVDDDKPRLTGQNAAILERLKHGPATNDELSRIARKYTSRISDLRAAGYRITCEREPGGDGLTWYRLEE
jgi:hypothetical protein